MKIKGKTFDLSYLDKKERELMETVERGEFKSVPNLEERKKELQTMAKNPSRKELLAFGCPSGIYSESSLWHKKGIPYQTLITSIIHRFADGTLTRTG